MIDLHNHLLPSVDDGPSDLAGSLALARGLVDVGVRQAVVTPHIDEWTSALLPDNDAVARRTSALQHSLTEAEIPLRIQPGGECYLTPELVARVRHGQVPIWGSSSCLLVELVADQQLLYIGQILGQIMRSGVRLILAHPERYSFVQAQPEALDELVSMGMLLQITISAFRPAAQPARRATAEALLRRGVVHLVASDAHAHKQIPALREGLTQLNILTDDATVRLLYQENPGSLLDGTGEVRPARVAPAVRRFRMPFGRRVQ